VQLKVGFSPMAVPGRVSAGSGGLYVSLTLLLALALLSVWLWARAVGLGRRFPVDRAFRFRVGCLLAAAVVSMLNSPWPRMSAFGVFEYVSLALIAMVAARWTSTPEGVAVARSVFRNSLLFQALAVTAANVLGMQLSLTREVTDWQWGGGRYSGTLEAPSAAGTFMAIYLLVFMPRLFAGPGRRARRSDYWLFGFGLVALLLTLTRSAWLGFLLGGGGMGLQYLRRQGRVARSSLVRLLGIAVGCVLGAWAVLAPRMADDHVGAAMTRWHLVMIALEMIKSHPLTGVGINTAAGQVWGYAAQLGQGGWVFIVHNHFLLVAAEMGMPALLAFVSLLSLALRTAWRCARSADPLVRETGEGLFWSLVTMAWALNMDQVAAASTHVLLWLLMGLSIGLGTRLRRTSAAAEMPAAPGVAPALRDAAA
jgi:O-antigen ligase